MVTQLLFGELFEVLAFKEKWACIKTSYDDYECWIDIKQYQPLHDEVYSALLYAKTAIVSDLIHVIQSEADRNIFPIVAGSSLPNFKNKEARISQIAYTYEGEFELEPKPSAPKIIEYAYQFLNTPYLWGGRSPMGIDCSGFTQVVHKIGGIKLKRDAWQQAEKGNPVSFIEEAKEADLAFFDNKDGRITHVGIVLKGNKIIHASGKVRIDTLDHQGIFNNETQQYTHKLRIIKRFI
jgi:cell wall-associated NlpC family hydrolase